MRLYAQVDLEVGFREPVKRRPQRLTVTHGSRSCPLTCTQRCERCGKFLLYSGDGGVPSGMAMPRGHTESAAASRCTLRPPAAAGPPPQVHPGRRRAARRGGPEGVPVDPDGQGKQAAAELGGAAWAREGECAVGVVPLLLGSYEVVREGEALHPLIRSHVRFFMLLRHSGRSPPLPGRRRQLVGPGPPPPVRPRASPRTPACSRVPADGRTGEGPERPRGAPSPSRPRTRPTTGSPALSRRPRPGRARSAVHRRGNAPPARSADATAGSVSGRPPAGTPVPPPGSPGAACYEAAASEGPGWLCP